MRKNEISSQKTWWWTTKGVSEAMAVAVWTSSVWKHMGTQQEVEYRNWLKTQLESTLCLIFLDL